MKAPSYSATPGIFAAFFPVMIVAACADTDRTAEPDTPPTSNLVEDDSCTVQWSYQGDTGPEHWADLSPCYAACAGQSQSPIDLTGAAASDLERLEPGYQTAPGTPENTGHSIQVDIQGGPLAIGGDRYDLVQFHFHTPSEHVIDGTAMAAEIHLVHADADERIAVLGLFVEQGAANAFMTTLAPFLPNQDRADTPVALRLTDLLPDNLAYFTYDGSLTTPPCSQGLRWIVLKTPVTFSDDQLALLKSYFREGNARPTQPLNGRTIYVSQGGG